MTQLLEKACARITQLPDAEQDAIATLILEELESEERWSQQFAASADVLSRLARKALAEHRAGRTLPLDPDTL
jgi:hypothetical protein